MKKPRSHTDKGIASLIIATVTFALLSVLARYLNGGFTILQQVYLRVFVALVLALIVFRKQLRWHVIRHLPLREWLIIAFRGLMGYAIGVTLISKAANTTLLSHVSFIAALPLVPLFGFILLKEKVTWWKLVFIGGAFVGVALLAVQNIHDIFYWSRGDVYAIVATLAFALGYIARKWHGEQLNNQEIAALVFVFGFAFVAILSAAIGEGTPSLHRSWEFWGVITLGGVLNVANMYLVNYGFEHIDAVEAGNLLNLESAWGLLFGLLLYNEWPTARGLMGGALIVASVIGMNIYSHREEAKIAPMQEESST